MYTCYHDYPLQLLEEVKLAHSLHNHTESLVTSLSGLQSLLLALNESLVDLLTSCNAVMNSALGNSSVGVACVNLTAINADSLYPRIHGDVEGWRSLLTELNQLLPIQPQPNTLNTTLVGGSIHNDLSTYMSLYIPNPTLPCRLPCVYLTPHYPVGCLVYT